NDHYEDAKRKMPDIGEEVNTDYGQGKIVGLNILETLVQIELYEEETVIEYTLDELIHEEIITVPVTEERLMLLNNRELFDQVTHMEKQIGELYEQLGSLRKHLSQMIEENHRLSVENEHLRHYLEKGKPQKESVKSGTHQLPGEGVDNLARIYKEGFHICHTEFGSPRAKEDCMFCLDLISSD